MLSVPEKRGRQAAMAGGPRRHETDRTPCAMRGVGTQTGRTTTVRRGCGTDTGSAAATVRAAAFISAMNISEAAVWSCGSDLE